MFNYQFTTMNLISLPQGNSTKINAMIIESKKYQFRIMDIFHNHQTFNNIHFNDSSF